jgi:hypothetical protein
MRMPPEYSSMIGPNSFQEPIDDHLDLHDTYYQALPENLKEEYQNKNKTIEPKLKQQKQQQILKKKLKNRCNNARSNK